MLTRRRVPPGGGPDGYISLHSNQNEGFPPVKYEVISETNKSSSVKELGRISGRDRTTEFQSVIKYTQTRNPHYRQTSLPKQKTANEFNVISNKIGKDIANTFEKLESLNFIVVSKKQDLTSQEVANQLSDVVRQDLTVLNRQIAQLQQFLKHQVFNRQGSAHCNSVIVTLQSKLATMSTDFKVVLEVKQQNVRNMMSSSNQHYFQDEHRNSLDGNGRQLQSNATGNNTFPHDNLANIPRSQRHNHINAAQQNYSATTPNYNNRQFQHKNTYYSSPHHQQQQSYQSSAGGTYAPQHSQMLRQRNIQDEKSKDEMVEIQQTIVELGGIFQQLATMVQAQGEMVERIDSQIDDTQLNIDVAHSELVKYFSSVASMRSFMLKVFVVLIIFIILFMFFYL